jgi:alcohol dehydrogenase
LDRGVVLIEAGRFGVEQIEVDPPGPGEVLVRLEASGICHSDLHVIETSSADQLPVLLGHEAVGIVEELGAGVSHVAVGDRVVLGWRSPCGSAAGVRAATRAAAGRRRKRSLGFAPRASR